MRDYPSRCFATLRALTAHIELLHATKLVLMLRALTGDQLVSAKDIFDDLRDRALLSAYLADAAHNRALLDKRVICDLLGFDLNIYEAVRLLGARWRAEPSVLGCKRSPCSL